MTFEEWHKQFGHMLALRIQEKAWNAGYAAAIAEAAKVVSDQEARFVRLAGIGREHDHQNVVTAATHCAKTCAEIRDAIRALTAQGGE